MARHATARRTHLKLPLDDAARDSGRWHRAKPGQRWPYVAAAGFLVLVLYEVWQLGGPAASASPRDLEQALSGLAADGPGSGLGDADPLVEFSVPGLYLRLSQALDLDTPQAPEEAAALDLLPPAEEQRAMLEQGARKHLTLAEVMDMYMAAGDSADPQTTKRKLLSVIDSQTPRSGVRRGRGGIAGGGVHRWSGGGPGSWTWQGLASGVVGQDCRCAGTGVQAQLGPPSGFAGTGLAHACDKCLCRARVGPPCPTTARTQGGTTP